MTPNPDSPSVGRPGSIGWAAVAELAVGNGLRCAVPAELRQVHLGVPGRVVAADRVRGMLLGLAIGDALGNTTEGQLPAARRRRYGEVRDYLPNRYADGRPVGVPSDDTQLAFWTIEHLLDHGWVKPDALIALFASRQIFGIGRSVAAAVRNVRGGAPWYEAAPESLGNGALMRIAPILLPHLRTMSSELWADAILATAVTHNDCSTIGTSVGFVALLADLLTMDRAPHPTWWIDRFVLLARAVEGERQARPRGGIHADRYVGPLWRYVDEQVREALARDRSVLDAAEDWYSGAHLFETLPTVLHILARHAHDPEEAIVRAVNDTKDNDTVAAIVGAAVGALHGEGALPARWVRDLLGRTGAEDDGRAFELLDGTVERFLGDRTLPPPPFTP